MRNLSVSMPEISVVIITHDRYKYLLEAIESAAKQTLIPSEIIVVDDGSPVPIMEQMEKDEFLLPEIPLRVVRIEDKGPAAARNTGAARSKSGLIAFLDDDDQWKSNYLEKCVRHMKCKNVDCVIAWLTCFDGKKQWPGKWFPEKFEKLDLYDKNLGFIGSNFVITRTAYEQISGFDDALLGSEDKDFLIRLVAQKIAIGVLSEPLVLYRIHPKKQASGKSSFHYFQVYGKYEFYKKHFMNMPRLTRWRLKAQSGYFRFRGGRLFSERLIGFFDFIISSPFAAYAILINMKFRKQLL